MTTDKREEVSMEQERGVPASPSGQSVSDPSPDGLGHAATVPNAVDRPEWLERFSRLYEYGAIEAVARAIARPILEEFDGEPYGTIKWDAISDKDRLPLLFVAQRAVRALITYAHASAIPSRRAETTGSAGTEGSAVPQADAPNEGVSP